MTVPEDPSVSAPNVIKQDTLHPPFGEADQLTTDQDVNHISASSPDAERVRLQQSLRSEDLESMHNQLWYAGRIGNISPLHHQKVICRDIVLTERAQLHLVWYDRTIYVQRLDGALMNWRYFSDVVCGDGVAYQAATGFLLSYTGLIQHPSDLEIAKASGLINKEISWGSWQKFRFTVRHNLAVRRVHDRFEYGELRLGRLNQIYRMRCMGLTYFTVYRDYSSYFGDNYMTLVALFALVSVALSAMQVMASVDGVSKVVVTTSYRFSIATLVGIAGSCAVLLALYLGLYAWNWVLILGRRRSSRKHDQAI
ncbi:hypothetical protein LTR95_014237 [Oleoguttula sp. CCFEE 5521]